MHRQSLLSLLEAYRKKFSKESPEFKTCLRLKEFVTSHADCFKRSLSVGHITGSAWILNRNRTHVLLTHHRKLKKWLQPGGHADGDSDILRVAMKEAIEESGIPELSPLSKNIFDVDIHLIPTRKNEPEHLHYDSY